MRKIKYYCQTKELNLKCVHFRAKHLHTLEDSASTHWLISRGLHLSTYGIIRHVKRLVIVLVWLYYKQITVITTVKVF